MKFAFLFASLLSMSALSADPNRENCPCEDCHCTPENHCGCLSPKRNSPRSEDDYLSCRRCSCGCYVPKGTK